MAHNNRSKGKGKSRDSTARPKGSGDYAGSQSGPSVPRTSATVDYSVDLDDHTPSNGFSGCSQDFFGTNGQPANTVTDQGLFDSMDLASSSPASRSWAGGSWAGAGNYIHTGFPGPGSVSSNWDVQSSVGSSRASTVFSRPYAPSKTDRSSPPPMYDPNTFLNHTIHSQPPPTQRYQLPCEIQGCGATFAGDEEAQWIQHTDEHLGGKYPSKLRCWFDCDFNEFDSKNPHAGGDTYYNFRERMQHIREHILDGYQPRNRIPDGFLIEHLRKHGAIDEQTQSDWLRPARVPSIVSGSRSGSSASGSGHGSGSHKSSSHKSSSHKSSSHHQHRSQYLSLSVLEEEGSGSRDRRSGKQSERQERTKEPSDTHRRKKPSK